MTTDLLVIAKAPHPGRSKSRLCPPCTPREAAALAEAALADTLAAVAAAPAARRVLVIDGEPGPWLPHGFEVLPQRGDGLDERLAAAFEDAGGPALLLGMDTPQITPGLLAQAVVTFERPEVDAVLGHAIDGGWWAIGLCEPNPEVFLGVPMSTPHTGAAQQQRLVSLGLRHAELPRLRDVDVIDDARAVASEIPSSRFALTLSAIESALRLPEDPKCNGRATAGDGLLRGAHSVGMSKQRV